MITPYEPPWNPLSPPVSRDRGHGLVLLGAPKLLPPLLLTMAEKIFARKLKLWCRGAWYQGWLAPGWLAGWLALEAWGKSWGAKLGKASIIFCRSCLFVCNHLMGVEEETYTGYCKLRLWPAIVGSSGLMMYAGKCEGTNLLSLLIGYQLTSIINQLFTMIEH